MFDVFFVFPGCFPNLFSDGLFFKRPLHAAAGFLFYSQNFTQASMMAALHQEGLPKKQPLFSNRSASAL
jgi:hypothetical protein